MSKKPSLQELTKIAASIRLTGDLLEIHGSRAVVATGDWSAGPASPNLDPTRQNRSEALQMVPGGPKEVMPVPNDPTGEAAIEEDEQRRKQDRLLHLIRIMDDTGYQLRLILREAAPQATGMVLGEPDTPAQVSAAGWCISCHRDGEYCEPVAVRPDGSRRYRDFCNWCGEMTAQRNKLAESALEALSSQERKKARKRMAASDSMPPIELVKARHEGVRITQGMVERAIARTLQVAPAQPKKPEKESRADQQKRRVGHLKAS